MYRNHKIIAWTPYGRQRTVALLAPYLLREHRAGVLDQWMLCMNTDEGQDDDVAYAHELADRFDWVQLVERPGPTSPAHWRIPGDWRLGYREPKQLNTGRFYWWMTARDAVYVRFDDDIVWVHENAIRRMCDRVLSDPEQVLGCFPVIWNNAICSWFLQQHGHLPAEWGIVGRNRQPWDVSAVDPIGWGDPEFAEKLHDRLLELIATDSVPATFIPVDHELAWRQQFSVSCFALRGEVLAELGGVINWDEEEHWLTCHYPSIIKRSNVIAGDAAVAHLTFFTQRDYILGQTDILERYEAIAASLERSLTKKAAPKAKRPAAAVAASDGAAV